MESTFGARLRGHREARQIALATIAERTKIKQSLLEELERDQVSHWPPGIFRRSYMRAYAQAIGLDADTAVREFLSLYPDPLEAAQPEVPAPAGGRESSRWPPTRLRFLIGSAMAALPTRRSQAGQAAAPPQTAMREPDFDMPVQPGPAYREHNRPVAPPAPEMSWDDPPVQERLPFPVDLPALAELCTRLARATEPREVAAVLEQASALLDAVGLVLWWWEPQTGTLIPVFSHGYSDEVVAQLSGVPSDADNAIANAFRSADTCVVDGNVFETGAIAVPLTTPGGCAGVLALELRDGGERRGEVRAFATILAAQLSTLAGASPMAQAATA